MIQEVGKELQSTGIEAMLNFLVVVYVIVVATERLEVCTYN